MHKVVKIFLFTILVLFILWLSISHLKQLGEFNKIEY